MRRRTLIASTAAALLPSAGCLASSADPSDDDATPTDDDSTATPSDGRPSDDSGSRFAGHDCPSFADTDWTVCAHRADESTPLVVAPDPAVMDRPEQAGLVRTVRFTLHNRSDWPFQFNPYAWRIERETDAGWEHVAPDAYPEPLTTVQPGGTYEWELAEKGHPSPTDGPLQIIHSLDRGTYAFSVDGRYVVADGSKSEDRRVELVALFEMAEPFAVSDPGSSTLGGSG